MKIEDKVKNIQWLFVSCLLVALFSRYTLQSTEIKLIKMNDFEISMFANLIYADLALESIEFEEANFFKEQFKEDIVLFQEEMNSHFKYSDRQPSPNLSDNNLLFDVTLTVKDKLKLRGNLHIEEFLVGNINSISDGDKKFLAEIVFNSSFVGEFFIRGVCKVSISKKENYIACRPNETTAYYKESDGYIMSVTPLDKRAGLKYEQYLKDVEAFISSGVEAPLVNAKVSLFEAWIGLLGLALFIQVFTLSTLRQFSEENQFIKGWMFVSWMSSDGTGFVKKITLFIEAFGGVSAFTLLVFIPVYSVWNSYNLRNIIGIKNDDNYYFLVISILLSMLVTYYLLLTFYRQLKLSQSERQTK